MTHQQLTLMASLIFGRVDITALSFEHRSLLGIRIDPTNSPEARHEALCEVERLLVKHLQKGQTPE